MDSTEETPTLEEMNSAEVERLIPTIVFLLLVSIAGILGNSLVIHVYRTRYKTSNQKYFVMCLSAVDLLTCCIAIPLDVLSVLDQYTFEYLWLCKSSRVFNTLGSVSSSFILLCIAVDRFRKVCKPFGWQIKTKVAKCLCGLVIFLSVLVSLPAVVIYGKHTFDIPEYNMTGTECSTADEMVNTKFPFVYALVFGISFVASIIGMSIIYCLIGHKVQKQSRKMREVLGRNISIPTTSSNIDAQDSKKGGKVHADLMAKFEIARNKNENMQKKKSAKRKKQEFKLSNNFSQQSQEGEGNIENKDGLEMIDTASVEERRVSKSDFEDSCIKVKEETEMFETSLNSNNDSTLNQCRMRGEQSFPGQEMKEVKNEEDGIKEILSKQRGMVRQISSISTRISTVINRIASFRTNADTLKSQRSQKEALARKTTFLMFIVTLGFILSFLPHLLLMLLRQVMGDFVENLSDTNTAVYKFFIRSFVLNSAINPIIYNICDSRFKSACEEIFGKWCKRRINP